VADQAIEVVGRGGSDIELVIGYRRVQADHIGHLQGCPGGQLKYRGTDDQRYLQNGQSMKLL